MNLSPTWFLRGIALENSVGKSCLDWDHHVEMAKSGKGFSCPLVEMRMNSLCLYGHFFSQDNSVFATEPKRGDLSLAHWNSAHWLQEGARNVPSSSSFCINRLLNISFLLAVGSVSIAFFFLESITHRLTITWTLIPVPTKTKPVFPRNLYYSPISLQKNKANWQKTSLSCKAKRTGVQEDITEQCRNALLNIPDAWLVTHD